MLAPSWWTLPSNFWRLSFPIKPTKSEKSNNEAPKAKTNHGKWDKYLHMASISIIYVYTFSVFWFVYPTTSRCKLLAAGILIPDVFCVLFIVSNDYQSPPINILDFVWMHAWLIQRASLSAVLCFRLAPVSVDPKSQLQLSWEAIYKSAGVQH